MLKIFALFTSKAYNFYNRLKIIKRFIFGEQRYGSSIDILYIVDTFKSRSQEM